jgi:hypothetical protein
VEPLEQPFYVSQKSAGEETDKDELPDVATMLKGSEMSGNLSKAAKRRSRNRFIESDDSDE